MFENKSEISYKLLIAAFILLALCSMLHPVAAYVQATLGNGTGSGTSNGIGVTGATFPGTYMINATSSGTSSITGGTGSDFTRSEARFIGLNETTSAEEAGSIIAQSTGTNTGISTVINIPPAGSLNYTTASAVTGTSSGTSTIGLSNKCNSHAHITPLHYKKIEYHSSFKCKRC